MMPGWTTATRFSRSISRIRSIAVKAMVRPPSMPAAPPDRPVPAPRGTIGTPSSPRSATSSATSAVSSGGRRRGAGPACEVGRLVEPVGLAVDRLGQQPEPGQPGARSPSTSGSSADRRVGGHGGQLPGQGSGWSGRAAPASASRAAPGGAGAIRGRLADGPTPAGPLAADWRRPPCRSLPDRGPAPAGRSRHRAGLGRTGRACALDATYDAYLRLVWAPRAIYVDSRRDDPQHLRRPDRPGRAQHDRRAPRRDAARPRDRRRRARSRPGSATRRSSCRSAGSCRPARTTRSGSATARRCAAA